MVPNVTLKLVWWSLEFFWAITRLNQVITQHIAHFPVLPLFLWQKKWKKIRINLDKWIEKSRGTCNRGLRCPHCVHDATMTFLDCDPTLGVFQKSMRQYEQVCSVLSNSRNLDLNLSESLPIQIVPIYGHFENHKLWAILESALIPKNCLWLLSESLKVWAHTASVLKS